MYKLQRREELDRQFEQLAELPTLKPMVQTLPRDPPKNASLITRVSISEAP